MPLKISLPLVFLFLALSFTVSAQKITTYNPALLVPYNDNGTWGYSDTLGNIIVEPQFKQAYFFTPLTPHEDTHYASVSTEYGRNYFVFGKGLAAQKELSVLDLVKKNENKKFNFKNSLLIVKNEK